MIPTLMGSINNFYFYQFALLLYTIDSLVKFGGGATPIYLLSYFPSLPFLAMALTLALVNPLCVSLGIYKYQ
jgi:hypothetical protein